MSTSMHAIHLYGGLKKFGPVFNLHVASVREAVGGLSRMVAGFGDAIRAGQFRIIVGPRDGRLLREEEVGGILPNGCDLHIVPAVQGAGGKGIGKIIVGVVLAVATWYAGGAGAYAGSLMEAAGIGAQTGATLTAVGIGMGISLAMSGAAMLLSPQAKASTTQNSNQNSFAFSGVQNTAQQGVPVPVVYGLFEVGSVVISSGISTQQLMN